MRRRKRLNLEMPEETLRRMERMRDCTEATSMSEVVRRALHLYEIAVQADERGETFLLRDEDGVERRVLFT